MPSSLFQFFNLFQSKRQKAVVSLLAVTSYCGIWYYMGRAYAQLQEVERIKQLNKKKEEQMTKNLFRQNTVEAPFRILEYPHFRITYSTYHKSPLAVHQIITKQLAEGNAPRAKFFFPDQQIKNEHFQIDQSYFYETEAYKRFNVNRGHMAAAGNYSGNQSQKFHTFAFSNVIPQNGYNNGGIWNTFERYARNLALSSYCESVQIISGPIYMNDSPKQLKQQNKNKTSKLIVLKENGIPIAQRLYKIIKCNSADGPYLDAFQFQNKETYDNDKQLEQFKTSIKSVEAQTGLTFNIQGKELKQLPTVILNKKKHELDQQFYTQLMKKSSTLSEMTNNFRRAKEQKIYIQLETLTEQIRNMTQSQISQINIETSSECLKLQSILKINKKLYSLFHAQKCLDLTKQIIQDRYKACLKSSLANQSQKTVFNNIQQTYKQQILKLTS